LSNQNSTQNNSTPEVKHISYSAVKESTKCPYRFKLLYVDRVRPSLGNEFTTFGNAIHSVLEDKIIANENDKDWLNEFDQRFLKYIKKAYSDGSKSFDKNLVTEMRSQGKDLLPEVLPAIKKHFGDYEVLGREIQLYEPIDGEENIKFKGFIDLVIHTKSDDKYHVIDYKTCGWGWDRDKKSDKILMYQIVLYKHFLSQKLNIDPSQIETYYVLLKRTGKTGNKVETFRVTSGSKRIENALSVVRQTISYVKRNKYLKNRAFCDKCDFFNTEHCKRS
jgi:ATP-dependent exoDNAse (exonuclease V) beta subunit